MLDLRHFRPAAVVFDLDGTLADNMSWHARAFDDFVARHGLPPVTLDQRHRMDGKRNAEIFPMLFERALSSTEIAAFEDEKESRYRELSRGRLRATAGAVRLLDRLAAYGVPVGIATSAPRENVGHTLGELGFLDRFAVVVRSDEVPRGKPAPDVYVAVAERFGVRPVDCLAFEDAPVGVTAARSASMACVAITSTFPPEAFTESELKPTAVCRDFDAFLEDAGRWLLEQAHADLQPR